MTETTQSISVPSPIKQFKIAGLFGDRDVDILFDSPITILVADNGSGKTTILSMIYAVLSRQLFRLRKYNFENIIIITNYGETIKISSDLAHVGVFATKLGARYRRVLHHFSEELLFRLIDETRSLPITELRRHPLVFEIAEASNAPPSFIIDFLRSEIESAESGEDSGLLAYEETRKRIAEGFAYPCLYFPTYRRIEEELEELGYARKEGVRKGAEGLIRFGMSDVSQRISEITGRIEKSSVEWYSRISGQMLSQLVDGIVVDEQVKKSVSDQSTLKIVLDRVGNNIGPGHKARIMTLVETGEITQTEYGALAYFLSNLVKVYDQQKQYDFAIKEFTRVCNKYLIDKQIIYDESSVDVAVVGKTSGKPVKLANLSSGEKQIVSLFSQLYLEGGETLALLFDEPELSLSIEWQKMLLPDIIQSGRCSFLLATTHSPFIFENELDSQAYDLERFVRRTMP